jgi:SAM-dependent methyltransferase
MGRPSDPWKFMLLALFLLNSFVCAALLFWLQPMFARMVLPLLGGSPSVWTTAMVFYQAALLAGYAYAHGSLRMLGVRRQARLHLLVLFVPLLFLPITVPGGGLPSAGSHPLPWLLGLLCLGVGIPFLVMATSSPLLQRWFSTTHHEAAPDPYLLYAASNAGSVLALLSYPLFIEPNLALDEQSRWWSRGYVVAGLLTAACVLATMRRFPQAGASSLDSTPLAATPDLPGPTWQARGSWLLLSLIPCSLMLGTTTFITTDLAAVPLLWVIPLTLYLITFILVFSRVQWLPLLWLNRALPILACGMAVVLATRSTEPMVVILPLSVGTFFVAAMVCHGKLAATRPPPRYLTEFYLWLAFGGLLGGVFNALIAPFLFTRVAEFPLALCLACLVGLLGTDRARHRVISAADVWLPAMIGGLAWFLMRISQHGFESENFEAKALSRALLFGIPTVLCFMTSRRPVRFGLALGALLLAGHFSEGSEGRVVHAERSFFGVHRVTTDREERFYRLLHGNTFHGLQSRNTKRRGDPLAYYHREGPIGQVFAALPRLPGDRIAVVGLGIGSLTAYAQPGEEWHCYEIDPAVERIARDARFFTHLRDAPANLQVILGDARLSLNRAPDRAYRMIVLDAYGSDAIPVHLLTREALQLYRDKLRPGGLLAFHISNVHLDLAPILADLARDAGWQHRIKDDSFTTPHDLAAGYFPSKWMLMAETEEGFGSLRFDLLWEQSTDTAGQRVWTDNYSSLIRILQWRRSS